MTISSRTPSGSSESCPLCNQVVVVEKSILIGDATCPRCGHHLWFFNKIESKIFFSTEHTIELRNSLIADVSNKLNVPPSNIFNNPQIIGEFVDSLDIVELVMELEESFDLLDGYDQQ